jgi:hypothetical protein
MKHKIKYSIILSILLLSILLPLISATDFTLDNYKVYNELTKTVQIWDTGQLGTDTKLIEGTLLTPQINYVLSGKDRRVAEITIEGYTGDYNYIEKLISQIKFYDKNNNDKEITRVFNYKVMSLENYEVSEPIYEKVCELNKTSSKEVCEDKIIDYKKSDKYVNLLMDKLDSDFYKFSNKLLNDLIKKQYQEVFENIFKSWSI